MFEISELKAKKLPELQDIAKNLNVPKYRSLKKLDLVYQILDLQAANPGVLKEQKIVVDDSKSQGEPVTPKSPDERVASPRKSDGPRKQATPRKPAGPRSSDSPRKSEPSRKPNPRNQNSNGQEVRIRQHYRQ